MTIPHLCSLYSTGFPGRTFRSGVRNSANSIFPVLVEGQRRSRSGGHSTNCSCVCCVIFPVFASAGSGGFALVRSG